MRRRVRLINKPDDKNTGGVVTKPQTQMPNAGSDGFSLHFVGGQGLLRLEGEQLNSTLHLELMEMAIPKIAFPFDVSSGIRGLRNRRHKLHRLKLSLPLKNLLDHICAKHAANSWTDNIRMTFEADSLCVLLQFGPPKSKVPVSFRLVPSTGDRGCSMILDDVWAYGPAPINLLTIAIGILREFSDITLNGVDISPPDPVKFALLSTLPKRGWRLPSHENVILSAIEMRPDHVQLEFTDPQSSKHTLTDSPMTMDQLRRVEELRLTRNADQMISKGEIKEARTAYSRLLDREPDNIVAAARLAMIDVIDADMRDTARALVADLAGPKSIRRDVRAVMAHGAALANDNTAEIESLDVMFLNGSSLERLAAGLRIGRLLLNNDIDRAITYFEGALMARREDPEALLTLLETCAVAGRQDKMERLIPRWIAVHKDQADRAKAHMTVGHLLLETLKDGAAAVKHFERAAIAEPTNQIAAWGLADALAKVGDIRRSIAQYERLERLCSEDGNSIGVARAIQSVGRAWMIEGEMNLAVSRFRETLELSDDPQVRLSLADALISLKKYSEAASELELVLGKVDSEHADFAWGDAAVKLAGIYMNMLDDPASAEPWILAANKYENNGNEAAMWMEELLERQGRWEELTVALERSLIAEPSVKNVTRLSHARLKAHKFDAAINTLEGVISQYPDDKELLELYIEACRGAKDFVRLKDALTKQFNKAVEVNDRAQIAAELGDMELRVFENPPEAISWLEQALNLDNDLLTAREQLIDALKRLGQADLLDKHLELLATAFSKQGRRSDAAKITVERAQLKIEAGDAKIATEMMRKALPDLSSDLRGDLIAQIAETSAALGDLEVARDMFSAARRESVSYGEHKAALGEAEAALKLEDHAAAFDAAIAAGSGPQALRLRAAMVAATAAVPLGKTEEAIGILLRVGENVSLKARVQPFILAAEIANRHLGQPNRALQILEQLLEDIPNCIEAQEAIIAILEQRGDRGALARGLVRFVTDDAKDAAVLKQAADFFSAQELYAEAADALRRAYKATNDAETSRMFAKILGRNNKTEEMLAVLRTSADQDEAAREMLIEQLLKINQFEESVRLIEDHHYNDAKKERSRLLKVADIYSKSMGDYEKAAKRLIEALNLGMDKKQALETAADAVNFAKLANKPALLTDALKHMVKVADKTDKSHWMFHLGGLLWKHGDQEKAEQIFEQALNNETWTLNELADATRLYPKCWPLVLAAVETAALKKSWELADEMLSIAISNAPDSEKWGFLRKRATVRRRYIENLDGAIDDMLEARGLAGLPSVELEALIDLLDARGDVVTAAEFADEMAFESGDANRLMHAARLNEKADRYDAALKLRRKAVSLRPEPASVIALAKRLDPANDAEEMDHLFDLLKDREDLLDIPDHMSLLEIKVALDLVRGKDLDAVDRLDAMINLEPDRNDPWEKIVHILERKGEWGSLAKRIEARLKLETVPDNITRMSMELGLLLMDKMGDEDAAVTAFERVIVTSPGHREANLALAKIAYNRQQWERIEKHLGSAEETNETPETSLWRAVAAENLGHTLEALEQYKTLISKVSGMPQAVEGLVRLADSADEDDAIIEAVSRLKKEIGTDRVRLPVHRRLGLALMRQGRLDEAKTQLELTDRLSGGDLESRRLICDIYRQMNLPKEQAESLCKLAYLLDGKARATCLIDAANVNMYALNDPKRAGQLFKTAAETDADHPNVLIGLADCAWLTNDLATVAKNLERYRLIVPEHPLDPDRLYRFAAALNYTRQWPLKDIVELLEQIVDRVSPNEQEAAATLLKTLKEG